MLWFCNKGNKYQVALYPGFSNITETFTPDSYIPVSLIINLPYYIQRIGYSKIAYEINGKEYWKTAFIEKSKGTYFE
jgi:hypothetical protein